MNPYEVGKAERTLDELHEEEPESDQADETMLLNLFLTIAARIAVYGILGVLLFFAILYWFG